MLGSTHFLGEDEQLLVRGADGGDEVLGIFEGDEAIVDAMRDQDRALDLVSNSIEAEVRCHLNGVIEIPGTEDEWHLEV